MLSPSQCQFWQNVFVLVLAFLFKQTIKLEEKLNILCQKAKKKRQERTVLGNMGYYHIELSPHAKQLCTIVFPWGKYECQCLTMGLCNSPEIFQERLSYVMEDLEYVQAYIENPLILTKGNFLEHLQKLATILTGLHESKHNQIVVCSSGIRIPWLLDNQKWNPTSSTEDCSNPKYFFSNKKEGTTSLKNGKLLLQHVDQMISCSCTSCCSNL
jgi:hypothetical protein